MECVGALSWSGTGWGAGMARSDARDSAKKRQRTLEHSAGQIVRAGGAGGAAMAATVAVRRTPESNDRAGRDDRGRTLPAMGAEVRPLEQDLPQDWTALAQRCMDGDSGAWAEMVRAHQKRVYGLCYRFTGNATDAEDLTQDVFLKIYSNLGSFDPARGSLPVWISTMTRNLLVDNFRRTRNQRATSSLDDGWEQTEELKPVDRLVAGGPSPHESAARKELAQMVQGALAKVSVELREAVILRDLQDLDYKEIAQVLAIPEGTVKSRISRGRAELARLLERNQREVM
jgi:RNA polymerase sigma-70 factor, ECF subfamily